MAGAFKKQKRTMDESEKERLREQTMEDLIYEAEDRLCGKKRSLYKKMSRAVVPVIVDFLKQQEDAREEAIGLMMGEVDDLSKKDDLKGLNEWLLDPKNWMVDTGSLLVENQKLEEWRITDENEDFFSNLVEQVFKDLREPVEKAFIERISGTTTAD